MSIRGDWAYLLGTGLVWAGIVFAILFVVTLVQQFWPANTASKPPSALLISRGVACAICLIVARSLPLFATSSSQIRLPVVWPAMHFFAWASLGSAAMAAASLVHALTALNKEESNRKIVRAAVWAAAALLAWYLFQRDQTNKVVILRGAIALSLSDALAIAILGMSAVAAMVIAARTARSRQLSVAIVNQLALLIGSIVFGLPFAFLLITSFKEDQDMSSKNGIVWIPRVTEQVPYFDHQKPLYESEYKGQTVVGTVMQHLDGNKVRIDISKPLSIRGTTFDASLSTLKEVPRMVDLVYVDYGGQRCKGMAIQDTDDGHKRVQILEPDSLKGQTQDYEPSTLQKVRNIGLRWQNYSEAISFLPIETQQGLVYLKNTLIIVLMSVIGTILSSSIVAYAFSRLHFPGRNMLFNVMLSTMMLPAAVTLLPQFLIFRSLGWIDTLYPLWVPAFFASAFNVFMLKQFFASIPMELEDAAKIDGCGYFKTFWSIMLPQIKPALAVIAIWTFMGAWNNFMGPLIYVNSPENMPIAYALQLFQGDRGTEPGLLMAFTTLTIIPVLALFFFAQRYFIEGVTLSGLGGR